MSSVSPVPARSLGWCFTLNNYTPEDLDLLLALDCCYIILGEEVAPTTGTPHLQGFVQFAKPGKTLTAVRKLAAHAHWTATKGSIDQNVAYCSKDGKFQERGIRPLSQKRKGDANLERWNVALTAAKENRISDIDADIQIRYHSSLLKIASAHQMPPAALTVSCDAVNEWIFGPPGCYKSSIAHEDNPDHYLKDLSTWWTGYANQDTVIIDDMSPFKKALADDFKQWGHHLPFPAQTKGGYLCIRPRKIVVTSNYSIDEVWEDEITRTAIRRRFKEIYIDKNHSRSREYSIKHGLETEEREQPKRIRILGEGVGSFYPDCKQPDILLLN